jgi:hypothetical protein
VVVVAVVLLIQEDPDPVVVVATEYSGLMLGILEVAAEDPVPMIKM